MISVPIVTAENSADNKIRQKLFEIRQRISFLQTMNQVKGRLFISRFCQCWFQTWRQKFLESNPKLQTIPYEQIYSKKNLHTIFLWICLWNEEDEYKFWSQTFSQPKPRLPTLSRGDWDSILLEFRFLYSASSGVWTDNEWCHTCSQANTQKPQQTLLYIEIHAFRRKFLVFSLRFPESKNIFCRSGEDPHRRERKLNVLLQLVS